MRHAGVLGVVFALVFASGEMVSGQTLKEPAVGKVPPEYQNKHMPAGWWTNPEVIEDGKELYEGLEKAMVVCSSCHGQDGRPMLPGARDLRDAAYVNRMTDSYWYWRVAEGMADTQMQGFKTMLKEEKIWHVIAYEHTFSHGGKPAEHAH